MCVCVCLSYLSDLIHRMSVGASERKRKEQKCLDESWKRAGGARVPARRGDGARAKRDAEAHACMDVCGGCVGACAFCSLVWYPRPRSPEWTPSACPCHFFLLADTKVQGHPVAHLCVCIYPIPCSSPCHHTRRPRAHTGPPPPFVHPSARTRLGAKSKDVAASSSASSSGTTLTAMLANPFRRRAKTADAQPSKGSGLPAITIATNGQSSRRKGRAGKEAGITSDGATEAANQPPQLRLPPESSYSG